MGYLNAFSLHYENVIYYLHAINKILLFLFLNHKFIKLLVVIIYVINFQSL